MTPGPDYSLLRKRDLAPSDASGISCDLFISCFDQSERVQFALENVNASERHVLVHGEYGFGSDVEMPGADLLFWGREEASEAEFWLDYFDASGLSARTSDRVVVDITGMMRPHIMLLPLLLRDLGFDTVDFLYTLPLAYSRGIGTRFTEGVVSRVDQVAGFEGIHSPAGDQRDLLIIGTGYEDELIRRAAETKAAARKMQLFGLPSLQPHMYQENHLCAHRAAESLGPAGDRNLLFAPAYNPFATAEVLQSRLNRERRNQPFTNLYLTPLGTRPQALGFAWYYLCELAGGPASILFPYSKAYAPKSSYGVSRLGLYHLELDWLLT